MWRQIIAGCLLVALFGATSFGQGGIVTFVDCAEEGLVLARAAEIASAARTLVDAGIEAAKTAQTRLRT